MTTPTLPPKEIQRATPTPKQLRLWDIIAQADPESLSIIGYGGAAGGGKTRGLVELAIDLATDFPGNKILIGRKDFTDLRTSTMEQFNLHCPTAYVIRRNNTEHWIHLRLPDWPEGVYSQVLFRDLKDWPGLMGSEYWAVLIDEAGEVPVNSVRALLSRMRWKLPPEVMELRKNAKYPDGEPLKRVLVAASNPWPGWFKSWFVDRNLPEEDLRQINAKVDFIPALARDNPHLPANYEASLRLLYPEDWVRRFMDGRWDAFIGQVYPDFNPAIHQWRFVNRNGVDELPDEKHWMRLIGGLDFGGNNPHSHMSAATTGLLLNNNRVIMLDEFEKRGVSVLEDQMKWMVDQEAKWATRTHKKIQWVADRTEGVGIRMLRQHGFVIRQSHGGPSSVMHGINQVNRRLGIDEAGFPGFFYLGRCTILPGRMAEYRYPEPTSEESAVHTNPIKRDDDLLDALRYMFELPESGAGNPDQNLINLFPTIIQ